MIAVLVWLPMTHIRCSVTTTSVVITIMVMVRVRLARWGLGLQSCKKLNIPPWVQHTDAVSCDYTRLTIIRLGWIRWAELIGWSNSDWPNGGHVMLFRICQFNRLQEHVHEAKHAWSSVVARNLIGGGGINFNWGAQWHDIESVLGHRRKKSHKNFSCV